MRAAQEALQSARYAAAQARTDARMQGSGAPGDRPRLDGERGAVIDLYA